MNYYKYVVTAQKATATHFAVQGNFMGRTESNLILGKNNRLEIYRLTADGLKPTLECNVYGTIGGMKLFRPIGRQQDHLFIITTRFNYCILSYSTSKQEIVTDERGTLYDRDRAKQSSYAMLPAASIPCSIDPSNRFIAALVRPSSITLIGTGRQFFAQSDVAQATPARRMSMKTSYSNRRRRPVVETGEYINLPLRDKFVVALVFVASEPSATMMVLYDNPLKQRFLQLFKYNSTHQKLEAGPIVLDRIEDDANMLIALPEPLGGVLLISRQYIRFLKPGHAPKAVGVTCAPITSYTLISQDGSRVLFGSNDGQICMLVMLIEQGAVASMGVIELGQASIPSCMAFLGSDVLYIGSIKGDNQLAYLNLQNPACGSLQILESYPNLGPISDFCVVDLDKQGQTQIITCSGIGNDGSLRIIRNGVGLKQIASIDIYGVDNVWALRPAYDHLYSNVLVISFALETRLLSLENERIMPLAEHSAIVLDSRTLAVANLIDGAIIQVTDKSVRLMEPHAAGALLDEWSSQGSATITVAALNAKQCVISVGKGMLFAFTVKNYKLHLIGKTVLENEVACIDLTPIDDGFPYESSIIAVGEWQQPGVRLLRFDSQLLSINYEPLATTVMPRSILLTRMEDICYLLVALGDGQVYNFKLDPRLGSLWDSKRSFLGKLPVSLSAFELNGATHVFAASDKPSIIHSRNQKLAYSNVNVKDVRRVSSFSSPSMSDAFALVCRHRIVIGQMEEIQKLHITKIPVANVPKRIAYQESTHTFGIVTEKLGSGSYTTQTTTGGFEILDDQKFNVLDRLYFKNYERPLAAVSILFERESVEYYAIATGKDRLPNEHLDSGRIMIFRVQSELELGQHQQKLTLVAQLVLPGKVLHLQLFKGQLLAIVGANIHMFEWHPSPPRLEPICSHSLTTITTSISTYGNTIVIGDALTSLMVLNYDPEQRCLEELAADEKAREISSIAAFNDSLIVGASRDGRLFVTERLNISAQSQLPTSQAPPEDPLLETVSEWHLGEIVQKIHFGMLGSKTPENKPSNRGNLIYATENGGIGLIADIPEERFKLLYHMQHNMTRVIESIGGLNHSEWRSASMMMDRENGNSHFIDGDLIEGFLDLTPQQMQNVVDGIGGGKKMDQSIDELCKVVEELLYLHS